MDALLEQVLMQIGLDALDQIIQLRHVALDAGLGKGIVVLNAIKEPPETPETIGLDLIKPVF